MAKERQHITEEEKDFIRANHQNMTVNKMAEMLKTTHYRVDTILKILDLKAAKKQKAELDFENGMWDDETHKELFPY